MIYGESFDSARDKLRRTKKAVLFDIDGTLLDTSQFIFKAFEFTLKTHCQKKITWDDLKPHLGKPLAYCYEQLLPEGEIERLCQTHHSFQLQNLHLVIPFTNTAKTLQKLKQKSFKIGAVTNRNGWAQKTLQLSSLDRYIDVLITPDDVKNQKPHKEPIVKMLKILGVWPYQALLVGDTQVDILAGKNSKVQTVGVTYGFLGKDIAKHKPDYLIDDIGELLGIV